MIPSSRYGDWLNKDSMRQMKQNYGHAFDACFILFLESKTYTSDYGQIALDDLQVGRRHRTMQILQVFHA